jgi:hypothetical protein
VFRGKFVARLRAAFAAGKLAGFAGPGAFAGWVRGLYATDWVVYSQPPFGGPAVVLKYLARYTHRVAISNHRLVTLDAGRVTFRYTDYADSHKDKTMTLDAEEFLRRFVQHVLPAGFTKVRHYGLLSNRFRAERLAAARRLLWAKALELLRGPSRSEAFAVEPAGPQGCERCGSRRLGRVGLPTPTRRDTS